MTCVLCVCLSVCLCILWNVGKRRRGGRAGVLREGLSVGMQTAKCAVCCWLSLACLIHPRANDRPPSRVFRMWPKSVSFPAFGRFVDDGLAARWKRGGGQVARSTGPEVARSTTCLQHQ